MTLPVSIYEALLVQVREITHETILLQQQLSSDLFHDNVNTTDSNHNLTNSHYNYDNNGGLFTNNDKKIIDTGPSLNDKKHFTFHQSPSQLQTEPESFDAEELAARLITWRNHNRQHSLVSSMELENGKEVVAMRHNKQLGTRLLDKFNVVAPSTYATERVGVEDFDVGSISEKSLSSSVLRSRLGRRSPEEAPHLRHLIKDPPLAYELNHSPNGRETSINKDTTSAIPQHYCMNTQSRSNNSEQLNSNGREFLRLYTGTNKNVMEPAQDLQEKSVGHNLKLFAQASKCYDEDGSSEEDFKVDSSSCNESRRLSPIYHGTWPAVKRDTWTAPSIHISGQQTSTTNSNNEMASLMSHSSSSGCSTSTPGNRRLGAKVDVVYSLLGMLSSNEGREDMSATLLAMSNSIDSCLVMRQSGCLPLLVQLIHAPGQQPEVRERASCALHNVVIARSEEKIGRREARVLRLLEQLRDYCQFLRISIERERPIDNLERHPGPTIAALMKLSFDEAHRHAMCQLGGVHAVAELIHMDHAAHGSDSDDQSCITLRRYAGMALTNLTFGDDNNKALLCSFRDFMMSLVSQLSSISDDLRQVTASVLRNLSWRADSNSKRTLREVGAVVGLMKAAMEGKKESTLKSILSALWNLSAHCSTNKVDICAMDGALAFLVDKLSYKAPSKTLSIVENAGGILRNVSNHIAMREDYRAIVREHGCLQVLLRQLRSPSLTVVSNACGTLWNLSARCQHDQRLLWDLGAVPMLRSLVHSKHKMISMGSSAALKNLLSARPVGSNFVHLDSTARGLGLPTLPSLAARRQRALEQEIDQNLTETCENIEPSTSPTTKDNKFSCKVDGNLADVHPRSSCGIYQITHGNQLVNSGRLNSVPRSESRESMRSITSTHSDTVFERVNRHVNNNLTPSALQLKQQSSSLHSTIGFNAQNISETYGKTSQLEKKLAMRYKNSIVERLRPDIVDDVNNLHVTTSTMSWTTGPEQESACLIDDKLSPTESIKSSTNNSKIRLIGKPLISPTLSHTSETDLFSNYAETDLDEPTNYSLRYAERNSDEDDKQISGYFPAREEQGVEDTTKIYYTEGTPCEISLNSSRAASHSDLQDTRIKQLIRTNQKQMSKRSTLPPTTLEIHFDSQKIDERTESECDDNNTKKKYSIVEEKIEVDCDLKIKKCNESKVIKMQNGAMEQECFTESMASDCDDDDEDLLAACINIGMQNNRHRQSFRRNSLEKGTRSEGNLTRYQTSIALDQVESNNINFVDETNELTSQQSGRDGLNIKTNRNLFGDDCKETTNRFTSLEDNLNISINDKITNDYQKLNTNDTNNESLNSIEENNIVDELTMASTTMDNCKLLSEPIEMPIVTMNSESVESFDSVERSEHVLLELCIKTEKSNNENIPIDKIKAIDSTDSVSSRISNGSNLIDKNETNMNENNTSSKNQADEYRRQRDPDAMIASLDRLTATLVQQTEAMRERELLIMKQSTQSDTWNEDSPNESFPTITMSVPLIGSFKSETPDDLGQHNPKTQNDDTNNETLSMTTSCLIEREAFRLADAVNAEIQSNSLIFNDDNNIDAIKPPSAMNSLVSLTASYISPETNINSFPITDGINTTPSSPLLKNLRKKSLPIGVIAKRAVGHIQQPQMGSLESLLFNDANIADISQLDNVKPPSMIDDLLLDGGDMENSMISVSSITSEVADSKETNLIVDSKTNSYAMATCIKYAESNANNILSDYLENINPPSLINEISDIDDTTIDANTDTMCSDTLCIENDLCTDIYSEAILNDTIDQIIDYDYDDEDTAMQIVTECSSGLSSSAESTPKKLNRRLTPKQKRQLAKERYKTYTIAAEMVKKEENEKCRNVQGNSSSSNGSVKYSSLKKPTPKQRRQEDRARFQTQVVENLFDVCADNSIDKGEKAAAISEKSVIPLSKNVVNSQNLTSKHAEDCESYRTRTLTVNENDSSTIESANLQTMLQQNASIVLHSLNETETKKDDTIQTLDYETISLVSNDLDAEMCSKMHIDGTSKKFMTFTKKSSAQQHIPLQTNEREIRFCKTTSKTVNEVKSDIHNETFDISDSDNEENEYQPTEESPKRPRIIKPPMSRDASGDSNNSGDKNEQQNTPKAIRGKRKPLYSNPITRKVTPQCSPVKISNNISSGIPIGRSNSSPIVRATRATTLRQNTNGLTIKNDISSKITIAASKLTTINKNSTVTKRSSIPQRGLTSIPTVKMVKRHSTPPASMLNVPKDKMETRKLLERQGTFTKDEPEVENAPTVVIESPKKSKIAKPTRNSPSKNYSINPKTKITIRSSQISQQSRLTKCASAEGIISPKVTSAININKRCSVVDNGKTIDIAKGNKKLNDLEQRSNSNSSIVSQNFVSGPGKKSTKEATSKIASLWKKVEENRKKQRFEKPDTRQWITRPEVASTATATSNDAGSSVETANFRLFRSSTFEGVPKQTDIINKTTFNRSSTTKQIYCRPKYGVSYRNSCDLTGMSATEAPCKISTKFGDTNTPNNLRSSTNIGYGTIVLRKQRSIESADSDQIKRISRLGSFICVECENETGDGQISAIVSPYNCIMKPTHDVTTSSADNHQDCSTMSS